MVLKSDKNQRKPTYIFDDDEEEVEILFESEAQQLVSSELQVLGSKSRTRRLSVDSETFHNPGCGLHWSVNMILHGISAAFVTFILYKAVPGFYFFSIHPICMAIAFGLLMFEAILFFSSWPIVGVSKKATKVTVHWILQAIVLTLSATGFIVVYYNKNRLGKNHFTTWHSWIGLVTLIATGLIAMGGIIAKYPGVLKKYQRPIILKSVHAFAGCITFGLACASLVTGLNSNYFTKLTRDSLPIWQIAYAVPPIMAIAALFQVIKSFAPRFRSK